VTDLSAATQLQTSIHVLLFAVFVIWTNRWAEVSTKP